MNRKGRQLVEARLDGRGGKVACVGDVPKAGDDSPKTGPAEACSRCGHSASPPERARFDRSPRDYTPRHLIDQILSSRSALEGQRKWVTILFVDVKGSMELADEIGAEELHEIMDRFFAVLSEGVHLFQGTINQFTGDGVMALFGAPIAHEDHACRACYAALHINEELRIYSAELKRSRGITFSVRMGMNSGEVVVGSIGDDLRMDYTAQGHTVGLAARMEQLADSGTIYLTEQTAAIVDGFFQLENLGRFEIKGLRGATSVFNLEGVGPMQTRLDRSHSRGLTTFVGRDEEMHVLDTALVRAMRGAPQVVGVIAEAGTGKSRLCIEFVRRCQARGMVVHLGHASAHGRLIPLLPILGMLRSFFEVDSRDEPPEARRKISELIQQIDPALSEGLPLLFEFLGFPDPDKSSKPQDPEARLERLLGILIQILHAGNRSEGCVYLIEDLHWLDSGTDRFIQKLVASIAGTRSLLVVNFRPDYHAGWMSKSYYQQLPLLPLDEESVSELLCHILGSHPSVQELRRAIHARCGGNPFFIEEVVQSLVDSGKLHGSRESYRLLTPVEHLSVPDTVHAVLDARIDQLSEPEKYVLQTAAVIGARFSKDLLQRVLEMPEGELTTLLQALTESEFIYECALYPLPEFAFVHPLTQEVGYRSQLQESRARIHGRVAQELGKIHGSRLDEHAALLAHHCQAAGATMQAAHWHRRAAEWLGFRNVADAHEHWIRVLELIGDAADTDDQIQLGLTARIWLLQLAWRLGIDREETTGIFNRGMELARLSNDEQATILLTLCFSIHLGALGELDAQYRYASQAARLARSLGATGLHRAGRLAMLSSLLHQGRIGEALDLAEAALGAPLELRPGEGYLDDALTHRACTLGLRALLLSLSGRMDSAGRELERAMKLNAEIEEPETRGYLHGFYVQHALCSGEVELALHHGREAARLADQTGIPLQIADAYLNLGGALLLAEDWSSAHEALERCRAIVEARESLASFRSRLSLFLSHVHLGRGEGELALRCAEESLANPATADTRVVELNSRLALVRALLYTQQSGAADAIQESLMMAIDGIDKTGAEAFRPTIHRVLAEIAEVARDERTRRLQLRRAHDLYSRIGARGHAHRLASSCSDVTDRVEEAIGRVADEVPGWLRNDSGASADAAPRDRERS